MAQNKRYALTVEYEGSTFKGWQRQDGVPTIQESLENALSKVGDQAITVIGAGRTDTGVHATGQVAHFDSTSRRSLKGWLRGANAQLPKQISILSISEIDSQFHARFSAIGRSYRYVILNRPVAPTFFRDRVTWEYRPLDVLLMQKAAQFLVGEHNFNAYRAKSCQSSSAVRHLRRLDIQSNGQWIWIDAEAESFLHHMIRNIVGVLISVGVGENKPVWANEVLASQDRRCGSVTAPPDGLYFSRVKYRDLYRLPVISECKFW